MDRRDFVRNSLWFAGAGAMWPIRSWAEAPAVVTRDAMRPQFPSGVQSGDATADSAIVWTRSDRPARMWVEWSTTSGFANVNRVRGPHLLEDSDFTGRIDLTGLPVGQEIFYRVVLQDLRNERTLSEPMAGHLRLPQASHGKPLRNVRFTWSGDTAGQGFGINEAWGGMKIYEQIRSLRPDFFLHSGDNIYADGPIQAEVKLADGSVWNNLVTEEVSKVAETLNEYRGRYRYNLMDANIRRMASEVPQIWQWDDHEVTNNWSDSKDVSGDARYKEKNVPLLVARATRAFLDYAPRSAAGCVRGGHAQLPRPQRHQPADRGNGRERLHGPSADRLAARRTQAFQGDVEGDRGGHAHRPGRARRQGCAGPRQVGSHCQRRGRRPAGPRAGDCAAAARDQAREDPQRGVADG
jgi:alkaline phosphatase D